MIFVGGLDSALTEGDVITIFSQYGEVLDINLPKWAQPRPEGQGQNGQSDREKQEAQARVGKRRGFGFLLYEDQRSTILAVDNLNGAQVLGRTLRVDHVKDYRQLEKDEATGKMREAEERRLNAQPVLEGAPLPKGAQSRRGDEDGSSAGSASPAPSIDLEDPMASYFAHQKNSGKKRTKAVEDAEKAAKKARKEERAKIREQREQRKRDGDRAKAGRRDDDDKRGSSRRSEHREDSRRSHSPRRRDYDERVDRYRSYEREERSRDRRDGDGREAKRYDDRYRDDDYNQAGRDDRRR